MPEDVRDLVGRGVRALVSLVVGFSIAFGIVRLLPVDANAIGEEIKRPMLAVVGFGLSLACAGLLAKIARAR